MIFYDFECYKHDWLVVLVDTDTQEETVIVNNRLELYTYYVQHKKEIWIGYNSNGYDQYILKGILCDFNPKEINDWIIVKHKKGWQFSNEFNKVQLYNYDVMVNRYYSLKQLEAFMGHDIRETTVPFDIDRRLSNEEIEEVIKYCRHDVYETMEVFAQQIGEFHAQMALITEFKLPLSNISKTQAQLSAKILSAWRSKDREDDYQIFLPETLDIKKYREVYDFFLGYNEHVNNLNIDVSDVPHTFAGGGVHGAKSKYHTEVSPDELMIMADVDQLYPTIMIEYDLLSRNVKQPVKFKNILERSLQLKKEGKKKEREPYKRICNITYGAEGDKYNPMYDPRNRLLVCIYGQLFILDLIEKLEVIKSYELIQSNTDGILVKIKRSDFEQFDDLVYEWEQRTGLTMSFEYYQKIFQKDVNNYIIVDTDGEYKSKGAYVKELTPLDNDLPIVNKAVVDYFVHEIPVEKTINECDEMIQFQKVVKISGKYDYAIYGKKRQSEKVFRLFASTEGKQLMKVKKGSPSKIAYTPDKCKIVNSDVSKEKAPTWLDRNFYITLARKRIQDYLGC